ncbi:ABC transporter permease [Latilactobacillus sakei]
MKSGQQKIDQSNQKQVGEGISLAITVLMFVFIVNYAGIIAQEIATEKGSRIMEIILSSVSATTQFFAKIAAVLALVLTQIVFYILIGVAGYHYLKQQLPLSAILKQVGPNLWTPPVWYAISFLIVGVLLYTVIATNARVCRFANGSGATSHFTVINPQYNQLYVRVYLNDAFGYRLFKNFELRTALFTNHVTGAFC